MHYQFRVGQIYRNRLGPYEVLSIEGPTMTIRYADGRVFNGDIATLARIWENLEAEAAADKPGATGGTQTHGGQQDDSHAPDRTLRPRNKGKQGALFEGLVEHDFQASVTGTSWRARDNLGGLLAQRLSEALGESFQSWAIYRRAHVYIAHPRACLTNRKEGVRRSKFFFALGPGEARYGFYIERDPQGMDEDWDWPRFVAGLRGDASRLHHVSVAMREQEIVAEPYVWESDDKSRLTGRLFAGPEGLTWSSSDGGAVPTTWHDFAALISSLSPTLWCDLYFQAEMGKPEAIELGVDIADRVVKTFVGLLPLYRLSLQ